LNIVEFFCLRFWLDVPVADHDEIDAKSAADSGQAKTVEQLGARTTQVP
jgi:hypothetical protein